MSDELVLEKYVSKPICLLLDDKSMLQCGDIVIADNVKYFDAATDINGNVHGVYMSHKGQIIYFRMKNGISINKTIASFANTDTDMSLTEDCGTLHILIVSGTAVYHFFTKGGSWIKSDKLVLKNDFEYISSCPCGRCRFAMLVVNGNETGLYINDGGKWDCKCITGLSADKETLAMSFYNGNIEIYYIENGNVNTFTVDLSKAEVQTNQYEEAEMANGNIINSKFIEQVNDNSRKTEDMAAELKNLSIAVDNMEKQIRQLNIYKETLRQFETQINQLGIKIQELTNRFNGVLRNSKQ